MHHRARNLIRLLVLATAIAASLPATAESFVYRGSLQDRGRPAEGRFGFRLTFYDAQFGGSALAPSTMLDGVVVADGGFSSELELDPHVLQRERVWLQVEVRDASGSFVPLAERDSIQPKALAGGVCWDTQGNGSTNPTTDFLGTLDAQPLTLRVANNRALRIEATGSVPNILGGPAGNTATLGVVGATIGGGGTLNVVTDSYGTVAGGGNNTAGNGAGTVADAQHAFVGGGIDNRAAGSRSAVAGGAANVAKGVGAAISGGAFNCAGGDYSWAGGFGAKVRPATLDTGGPCTGIGVGPAGTGDTGTFVWADIGPGFESTGSNQFLVRAAGGIGFNTSAVADATVAIGRLPGGGPPVVRLFNNVNDQILGGRVLISENATSPAGGYINYDAFNNVFAVGTNSGAADSDTLFMPRGAVRLGVGRVPAVNTLEVEGNASKTTATTWLANSDARIKQDIAPVEHALDTLMRVRPVTFRYSAAYRAQHPSIGDGTYYNVIAQEFAQVFPDAVQRSGELLPGAKAGSDNEILQVDVHPALITTIAAAQELSIRVDEQAVRIARLEADNARLAALLERVLARDRGR